MDPGSPGYTIAGPQPRETRSVALGISRPFCVNALLRGSAAGQSSSCGDKIGHHNPFQGHELLYIHDGVQPSYLSPVHLSPSEANAAIHPVLHSTPCLPPVYLSFLHFSILGIFCKYRHAMGVLSFSVIFKVRVWHGTHQRTLLS